MIILKSPQKSGQTIEVNLGNGKQTYTVSGIMDVENDSRMFQLYVSEAFVEEMAQGEPLFEFRLRYTGADDMELEQLKAGIAAFFLPTMSQRIRFLQFQLFRYAGL